MWQQRIDKKSQWSLFIMFKLMLTTIFIDRFNNESRWYFSSCPRVMVALTKISIFSLSNRRSAVDTYSSTLCTSNNELKYNSSCYTWLTTSKLWNNCFLSVIIIVTSFILFILLFQSQHTFLHQHFRDQKERKVFVRCRPFSPSSMIKRFELRVAFIMVFLAYVSEPFCLLWVGRMSIDVFDNKNNLILFTSSLPNAMFYYVMQGDCFKLFSFHWVSKRVIDFRKARWSLSHCWKFRMA